MTRQDLGTYPSTPYEVTTVQWVTQSYPSFSASVSTSSDLTISLPADPVDHTMLIAEVNATAEIVVSIPEGVLLTTGTAPSTVLFSGKAGFFGFRYSATASAWLLLSVTSQV